MSQRSTHHDSPSRSSSTSSSSEVALPPSTIWLMVDHSSRAEAFGAVAETLKQAGHRAEVVTMSEALGTIAREAFTGGAERVLRGLRVALQGSSDEDLIGAVRRVKPDVMVVTSPRHTRALSLLEGLTKAPMLQIGVLPNYDLDVSWLKSGLEAFIVPHEEFAERLRREGHVPAERIAVAGPAVQPGFARELEREGLRRGFGFSQSEQLVMVRAETFEVSTLEKLVFQAKLVEGRVRYIFHHNGDGAAAGALRRAASEYGLKAVMFGHVEDLERYVAIADAVLTKPGDPMMPEIIALGRPVLLIGRAGEASAQAAFLERHRIGRVVEDVLRLGSELERFLEEESLKAHAEAAAATGLPSGSEEVGRALQDLITRSATWSEAREGGGDEPSDEAQGDGDTEGEGEGGAFETIGGARFGNHRSSGERSGRSPGRGDERDSGRERTDADQGESYAGISRAEAKEQLAELILAERDLERRLTELEREQERWRSRLDLARQWNEEDLAEEAEQVLRGYLEEARPLQRELDGVRRQKLKLKAAASHDASGAPRGASGSDPGRAERLRSVERRFRRMEESRDLDDLKDRIGRELDD